MCLFGYSIIITEKVPRRSCGYPPGTGWCHQQTILPHRVRLQQKVTRWKIYRAAGIVRPAPQHLQRETGQLQLRQDQVLDGMWSSSY